MRSFIIDYAHFIICSEASSTIYKQTQDPATECYSTFNFTQKRERILSQTQSDFIAQQIQNHSMTHTQS